MRFAYYFVTLLCLGLSMSLNQKKKSCFKPISSQTKIIQNPTEKLPTQTLMNVYQTPELIPILTPDLGNNQANNKQSKGAVDINQSGNYQKPFTKISVPTALFDCFGKQDATKCFQQSPNCQENDQKCFCQNLSNIYNSCFSNELIQTRGGHDCGPDTQRQRDIYFGQLRKQCKSIIGQIEGQSISSGLALNPTQCLIFGIYLILLVF